VTALARSSSLCRSPRCATGSTTPTRLRKRRAGQRRPSDAIALALRAGATIYGEESVLDEAGVIIPDEQEDDEVEKFREFLDTISPDDFAGS